MSTLETPEVRQLRADARRNRERIIEAAKEVFAQQGGDAQMDDVARQAGVGVGTVYRHFPSKDVLIAELVREKFALFSERVNAALTEDDAWEALCGVLRSNAEMMAENVALQEALRGGSIKWEHVEPARVELERASEKLIRRAQRAGKMRKDFKAHELGMLMGGVCASMRADYPGGGDWRRHLEIVIDGLRAKH